MKLPNTVINFHVIQNEAWMEANLKVLLRHFHMVSASQLEKFYHDGLPLKNACHITVDDGDISVYTHLFPLIKKYQIPISIYVSPQAVKTGKNFWFQEIAGYSLPDLLKSYNHIFQAKHRFINKYQVNALLKSHNLVEIHRVIDWHKKKNGIDDKPRRSLTLEQLTELRDSGLVEIGSHTLNHPILKNETEELVDYEISQSILDLEILLGEKVSLFAYPNGIPGIDFGLREMQILKKCGIKLAFSTKSEGFSLQDNPFSIPRRGITKGGPVFVFSKLAIGNFWETLKKLLKGKQEPDFRRHSSGK